MTKPPKLRCAIYTRKSTEEGLEQEFNSLDAQREASEAYIKSQMHEGWEVVPKHYDDGGFSGGNINRPAMQELLADVQVGKIDVVVVYKVDRLSRALNDFAKMVEIFDKHNVSFVSVTQQFNTTTSMGRLTLNVLLSFAQFEREVTGERIRDKFAASKKKGMWMGGNIPLGYDVISRKLVVNEDEVAQVRLVFEKYLELKSYSALCEYLNSNCYKSKSWVKENGEIAGGGEYTKNILSCMLSNPIYLGQIRHKDQIYEGEHEAIIDLELWRQVQKLLHINFVGRSSPTNQNHEILFKSKVFDAAGNIFTTTYTKRGNKRYQYYLNKTTKARISVVELNAIISNAIASIELHGITLEIPSLSKAEICNRYYSMLDEIAKHAVDKIIIDTHQISVLLSKEKLTKIIENYETENANAPKPAPQQHLKIIDNLTNIEIIMHIAFRSYAGRKIAYSSNGKSISINKSNHNQTLIRAIFRSYKWNKMLDSGDAKTIQEIATIENVDRTYASDILKLKYLSPEITTMILNGTQPRDFSLSDLTSQKLPLDWNAQKTLLNIA